MENTNCPFEIYLWLDFSDLFCFIKFTVPTDSPGYAQEIIYKAKNVLYSRVERRVCLKFSG